MEERKRTRKAITEAGFAEVIKLSKARIEGKPMTHLQIAKYTGYGESTVGFIIQAGTLEQYRIDSLGRRAKRGEDAETVIQSANVQTDEPVQIEIQGIEPERADQFESIMTRLDAILKQLVHIENRLIKV